MAQRRGNPPARRKFDAGKPSSRLQAHGPFRPRFGARLLGAFGISLGVQPDSTDDVDGERMPKGAIKQLLDDPESGGRLPHERWQYEEWREAEKAEEKEKKKPK